MKPLKVIKSLALGLVAGTLSMNAAKPAANIVTNVEPPYWWTGMANDTLQIMLTGNGVAEAEFSLNYPGVKIDRQLSLDSPNYKFLYLTIDKDARPGTMTLDYTVGKKKMKLDYELKQRTMAAEDYKGFDAGDVLYLLMPDRFAKGGDIKAADIKGLDHPIMANRENPNARHGGDMQGIADHLDYIDSLGVTAIRCVRCWRTICPAAVITAMPQPTTIASTLDSAPTPNIRTSLPKPTTKGSKW